MIRKPYVNSIFNMLELKKLYGNGDILCDFVLVDENGEVRNRDTNLVISWPYTFKLSDLEMKELIRNNGGLGPEWTDYLD